MVGRQSFPTEHLPRLATAVAYLHLVLTAFRGRNEVPPNDFSPLTGVSSVHGVEMNKCKYRAPKGLVFHRTYLLCVSVSIGISGYHTYQYVHHEALVEVRAK